MASTTADRPQVSGTATGIGGTFTCGAAQTGYRTFADAVTAGHHTAGDYIDYVLENADRTTWEVRWGTVGSGGTTLTYTGTRSSSTGSAIDWTGSGTLTCYETVSGARLTSLKINASGNQTLSVTSGTITASDPAIAVTQTWNSGGTTFKAATINITNTASAAASTAFEIQASGTTNYSISRNGLQTKIGGVNGILINDTLDSLFIGQLAGNQGGTTITGYYNVGVGMRALQQLTTGVQNTAVGGGALQNAATISNHIAIGPYGLNALTAGTTNLALGISAGSVLTSGSNNLFIGSSAGGTSTSGDSNILIGNNVYTPTVSTSSYLSIGQYLRQDMTANRYMTIGATVVGTSTLEIYNNTATTGDTVALVKDGAARAARLQIGATDVAFARSAAREVSVTDGSTTLTNYGDMRVRKHYVDQTITAGGTTGAQTINKAAGTVNFAAAATSLVVTNNLVTTSSTIYCSVRTNDTTALIKNVVPASGSFTITLNAAATAETSVGFFVVN